MVPIARKNLLAEKARLGVAVGGVTFAVFLIVLIQSLFLGVRHSAGALIEDLPFQLWVVQDSTFDLYHSTSLLPSAYAGRAMDVPGVASAQRVAGRQVRVPVGSGHERELFLAFDAPVTRAQVSAGLPAQTGAQPPAPLLDMAALPQPGQMIVSSSLARKYGIEVGQAVRLGARQFTVAGTTGQGAAFRYFSFLNFDDAVLLFGLGGDVNYVTVTLQPGADEATVARSIEEALPGVDVVDRQEFADRSRAEIGAFTPVLAVLLAVGFIVGAAVISLTIYTATVEKAREYGVLKALGASSWYLYRLVTVQSLCVGVLGFALGVPLAVGASAAAGFVVPEFVTLFQWQAVIGVLAIVLLMSLAAAYLPIHRIARIQPTSVFRA
ncbi:MAG TPA: FtsX-like permease family protein [Dehalococcoidia bacterium]|nr:FtsX-like permease family protein [Dehalococcoidia bacterium]